MIGAGGHGVRWSWARTPIQAPNTPSTSNRTNDILVCRTERELGHDIKEKLALFCSVVPEAVIEAHDVKSIYEVPLMLQRERMDDLVCNLLRLDAPPANMIREGSYVVDRTGRLTKSADGQQWEFTFDADGKTMQDPPLPILPNLNLAAMESAVSTASRDLRFRVTGMVTEYKGKNYILLEKVVVVPDVTQQF